MLTFKSNDLAGYFTSCDCSHIQWPLVGCLLSPSIYIYVRTYILHRCFRSFSLINSQGSQHNTIPVLLDPNFIPMPSPVSSGTQISAPQEQVDESPRAKRPRYFNYREQDSDDEDSSNDPESYYGAASVELSQEWMILWKLPSRDAYLSNDDGIYMAKEYVPQALRRISQSTENRPGDKRSSWEGIFNKA